MITVQKAELTHVEGISKVCSNGYRDTYRETHSQDYIERIIREFYNHERIRDEVLYDCDGWDGWFVALDDEKVVGAIGGGIADGNKAEVYVLYLDPNRRREGMGSLLLDALTNLQKEKGATEQWVSVSQGNDKGIPFYEARGFVFECEQESYANDEGEAYKSFRYYRKI